MTICRPLTHSIFQKNYAEGLSILKLDPLLTIRKPNSEKSIYQQHPTPRRIFQNQMLKKRSWKKIPHKLPRSKSLSEVLCHSLKILRH